MFSNTRNECVQSLSICLVGATGRMGKEIVGLVVQSSISSQDEVHAGIVNSSDPLCGSSMPGVKCSLASQWQDEFSKCNVIIDFSSPAGAEFAANCALEQGLPLVACTTGLSADQEKLLCDVAKHVPVLRASNTSVGINVMLELVREAAGVLEDGFDVEISEIHHRGKRDAPSGTALSLADSLAAGRSGNSSLEHVYGRDGIAAERRSNELGVMALRGGDVAGEHTVFFFGQGERLEITHRATKRTIFAQGAIRAARWLVAQKLMGCNSGMFQMKDALGIASHK